MRCPNKPQPVDNVFIYSLHGWNVAENKGFLKKKIEIEIIYYKVVAEKYLTGGKHSVQFFKKES
jgi:hypothetical protein